MISFAKSLFKPRSKDRDALLPLYRAVVAAGRDPYWYRDGQVPDTVDGRFDMIAAIAAIVLVRMERIEGDEAKRASVMLTETFIDDMDGSLRQIGIGDYVVGKHVGRLMGALGGRLGALREAGERGLEAFAIRNIFHDAPPSDEATQQVAARLERIRGALREPPLDALLAGRHACRRHNRRCRSGAGWRPCRRRRPR